MVGKLCNGKRQNERIGVRRFWAGEVIEDINISRAVITDFNISTINSICLPPLVYVLLGLTLCQIYKILKKISILVVHYSGTWPKGNLYLDIIL